MGEIVERKLLSAEESPFGDGLYIFITFPREYAVVVSNNPRGTA